MTPTRLQHIGIVYVAIMLLIAIGGITADRTPRVLLVGTPENLRWDVACGCTTGTLRNSLTRQIGITSPTGELLNRRGYLLAIGRVFHDRVLVDTIVDVGQLDADPQHMVDCLRERRAIAAVMLFALCAFGWGAISFSAAMMATLIGTIACSLVLDLLAIQFGIGLPDAAWASTLAMAGCAGWKVARHFDAVLDGKAQSVALSVATALLFRDVGGMIAGAAGIALPALSRRVALGFLIVLTATILLNLPDHVLQVVAGSSLVVAAADRWRLSAASHRQDTSAMSA